MNTFVFMGYVIHSKLNCSTKEQTSSDMNEFNKALFIKSDMAR